MAAEIELPDGEIACYTGGKWDCSDPKAIPVLEYFTAKVFEEEVDPAIFANPCADVAARVVAKFLGAKLIRYDSAEWRPDVDR
jgi:hypothetical protein